MVEEVIIKIIMVVVVTVLAIYMVIEEIKSSRKHKAYMKEGHKILMPDNIKLPCTEKKRDYIDKGIKQLEEHANTDAPEDLI